MIKRPPLTTCIRCGKIMRQTARKQLPQAPIDKLIQQMLPALCPTCKRRRQLPRTT